MSLVEPALVRLAATQLRHSRKARFAVLVSLVPVLVGLLLVVADGIDQGRPAEYVHAPGFAGPLAALVIGGTVPIVALLLAGGLVADDVEDRTLSYVLVRPIRRRAMVVSKFLPVATLAAILAAGQALAFGLLRLVAYLLWGFGTNVTYGAADAPAQVDIGLLLAWMVPVGMVACALVAVALCAIFGFVSLVTTRFHFVANILILLAFELPFANLGGLGLGALTSIFHGVSLVDAADPTSSLVASRAPLLLPLLFLPAWALLWLWLAARRAERRDFNVTSAAS